MSHVPITSTGRVRRFLEIRDANYRNRGNVIETVFEFIGPDPVEHRLTMHDLEAFMTEYNATAAIAEQAKTECEQLRAQVAALKVSLREDVELVAEVCNDYGNDEGPREIRRLYAQFEARIEAAAR